jgi:fructoselysine-6-P-deglycase FrlB-like protein
MAVSSRNLTRQKGALVVTLVGVTSSTTPAGTESALVMRAAPTDRSFSAVHWSAAAQLAAANNTTASANDPKRVPFMPNPKMKALTFCRQF